MGCHRPSSNFCMITPPVANPETSTSIRVGLSGFQRVNIGAEMNRFLNSLNASCCRSPHWKVTPFLVRLWRGRAMSENPCINTPGGSGIYIPVWVPHIQGYYTRRASSQWAFGGGICILDEGSFHLAIRPFLPTCYNIFSLYNVFLEYFLLNI